MKRKLIDFFAKAFIWFDEFRCMLAELISCTLGVRITIWIEDLIDDYHRRNERGKK